MNYNEYNSNGEKKKILFDLKDKTSRSRIILFVYFLIFVFLIIFVRSNYKGNVNNNQNIDQNTDQNTSNNVNNQNSIEKNDVEKKDNTIVKENEIDSMFSFIDSNNYEFKYTVSYNGVESVIIGKKYNNKYDFSLTNNDEIIFFNGTSNYIKVKTGENENYKSATFPYVLVNFFDSNILKEIINNSNNIDGIYKIENSKLSKIIREELRNENDLNEIELVKRNNKVVSINIDLTNAFSAYSKEKVSTKLKLEYYNFGLVDDFALF